MAIAVATYFSVCTEVHVLPFQRFPGTAENRTNYGYAARRTYGTVIAIAIMLLAISYPLGGDWQYALAIAGWGFGVAASRFVATAWLGWMKPWSYAGAIAVSTTVRTTVLITLITTTGNADTSMAIAGLTCGVAALLAGPRLGALGRAGHGRPWRLTFGVQLALTSAAITLMGNAVLVMLPLAEAPEAVGRFAAMAQFAALTSGSALGLLTTVAYPRLRQAWDVGRHEDVYTAMSNTALLIIATTAGVLAVASTGDHRLVRLAVAENLRDLSLLPAVTIATAIAALAITASWEHQFRLEVRSLSRRTLLAVLAGTALVAILVFQLGLPGAAFGVVAMPSIHVLFVASGTYRPFRRLALTTGLATAALLALLTNPSPTVVTIVSAAVASLVGAVLLRRLRARHV